MCAAPPQLVADQRDQNKLLISAWLAKKKSAELSLSASAVAAQTRARAWIMNAAETEFSWRKFPKAIRERGRREIFRRFRERDVRPAHDYYSNRLRGIKIASHHTCTLSQTPVNYANAASCLICAWHVAGGINLLLMLSFGFQRCAHAVDWAQFCCAARSSDRFVCALLLTLRTAYYASMAYWISLRINLHN